MLFTNTGLFYPNLEGSQQRKFFFCVEVLNERQMLITWDTSEYFIQHKASFLVLINQINVKFDRMKNNIFESVAEDFSIIFLLILLRSVVFCFVFFCFFVVFFFFFVHFSEKVFIEQTKISFDQGSQRRKLYLNQREKRSFSMCICVTRVFLSVWHIAWVYVKLSNDSNSILKEYLIKLWGWY